MRQAVGSRSLDVLVVTENRTLQRRLTQFFDMVGYQAVQAATSAAAQAAVDATNPHIVLIDADLAEQTGWELCNIQPMGSVTPPFRFLLVEQSRDYQLREALEAGIDDFLELPIRYGELLTRMRSAAQVLEYDQRIVQQDSRDPFTGLASKSELTSALRRLLKQPSGQTQVSCVVFDIDFFRRVEQAAGRGAARSLLKDVASELSALQPEQAVLACFGGDRFCALLPGFNEAAAAQWAERVASALAEATFTVADQPFQLTVSAGAASSASGGSAVKLLEQANQALLQAQRSGRNCVIRYSVAGATGDEQLEPETLFAHTTVTEVMAPCTVFLKPHEPLADAAELLKRTRLDAIPVIDTDGLLLGVCERARVAAAPEFDYPARLVRDLLTTNVQTFEASANLSSLMQFFSRDERSLAVIVDGKRPIGLVTCDSLVALSRPLTAESLASESLHAGDDEDELRLSSVQVMQPQSTA